MPPSIVFNQDKVRLSMGPNVASIDFHTPDGNAIKQNSSANLDGPSTECVVKYRGAYPPQTYSVHEDGKMNFPDTVDVTVTGPIKDEQSNEHKIWATASDGTRTFKGSWTLPGDQ